MSAEISFFKVALSAREQGKNKLAKCGLVRAGQDTHRNSVTGIPAAAGRSLSVWEICRAVIYI